ncbi:phosphatase PAP2 family protein (plasmid) [Adhaeribacter swui]|uniref:Phosphatase PAP2 family protein n=1 Tax=Adhaeribacter swui TaxID=2086471 RepID=A0A7G7G224_9BACT|nr:phosphatase PAP2 family protein [Adhaeribacter swui]QNF31208.1 phosphatase PAP2 family protein [Adhaeribacter swui]
MRRLEKRYPRAITFLHARFSPVEFIGLPLTLLLLVSAFNIVMLSELAEHIVNSPVTKAIDIQVSTFFYDRRIPGLSLAFYYYTQLGNVYSVTIMTIITAGILAGQRKGVYLMGLLVSVLGSGLSMQLLKNYFHRERPLDIGYYAETSYSFPSGHSTGAMALAGILIFILLSSVKKRKARLIGTSSGLAYIFLMGLSRIYLGVHFLTDVTAGFLLGFLWLLVSISVVEYLTYRKVKKSKVNPATNPDSIIKIKDIKESR